MEVIDLRSIVPLDEELIYRSVRKTSRVVIAHEDSLLMGFGAEIAARIAANCLMPLTLPLPVLPQRIRLCLPRLFSNLSYCLLRRTCMAPSNRL